MDSVLDHNTKTSGETVSSDSIWEFDAPKFYDFASASVPINSSPSDDYFKRKRESLDSQGPEIKKSFVQDFVKKRKTEDDEQPDVLFPHFKLTSPKEFNFATSKRALRTPRMESTPVTPASSRKTPAVVPKTPARTPSRDVSAAKTPGSAIPVQTYYPTRSVKPLTEPKEFSFATERTKRRREESNAAIESASKVQKTTNTLAAKKPVQVKPPRYTSGTCYYEQPVYKPDPKMVASKPTAASQAATKSKSISSRPESKKIVVRSKLTEPKSPKFRCTQRSALRAVPKPTVEAEKPALEKFKARPAPRKILSNSSATAGIPRVTKAPQTKSAEITLNTVKRARTQAPSVSAKPAEKKPQPSAKKESKFKIGNLTLPQSPQLSTSKRASAKKARSAAAISSVQAVTTPSLRAPASSKKTPGKPTLTIPTPFRLHTETRSAMPSATVTIPNTARTKKAAAPKQKADIAAEEYKATFQAQFKQEQIVPVAPAEAQPKSNAAAFPSPSAVLNSLAVPVLLPATEEPEQAQAAAQSAGESVTDTQESAASTAGFTLHTDQLFAQLAQKRKQVMDIEMGFGCTDENEPVNENIVSSTTPGKATKTLKATPRSAKKTPRSKAASLRVV